jgi:hypothetical protein
VPLTVIAVTVRLSVVEVLVTVTELVLLLPSETLPKERLLVEGLKSVVAPELLPLLPELGAVPDLVGATLQPVKPMAASNSPPRTKLLRIPGIPLRLDYCGSTPSRLESRNTCSRSGQAST